MINHSDKINHFCSDTFCGCRLIDFPRPSLSGNHIEPNEKRIVPYNMGGCHRKDFRETETSWVGVKSDALNRLIVRRSVRSCDSLRRLGVAVILLVYSSI